MRDDLELLFNSLIRFQYEKIEYLEKILNIELQIKNILEKKTDIDFEKIIEFENEIINKINLLDFDITSTTGDIRQRGGIDPDTDRSRSLAKTEPLFNKFTIIKNREKELLVDINKIKSCNIKEMERILRETLKEADEIGRIDRIKMLLAKYLRSS